MSRTAIRLLSLVLLVVFTAASAAIAVAGGKPAAPPAAGKPAGGGGAGGDSPYQDWSKVTKDAEVKTGFFKLYSKRENLYLELRPDQLDKPVLAILSIAHGIGANGLLGGMPQGQALVEFHRSGDHVLVIADNTQFVAPPGSPVEKARDLSHSNSVLASLKIESVQDSSKAVLVDLAPFVVSDISDLAESMKYGLGNKSVRFDQSRSSLGKVKDFPENVEIEAELTYSPNDRQGINLNTIPDERYIPVGVHYSFSKLPDVPMQPRLADDRTGYFLTAMKDFGLDTRESFWLRYINHWRLEKKDPGAALSEPVQPIVYYIDRTVPEKYRPYIKEGVERWQKAFEAAGFKNAIIAKDAPDDPNWDPEDVRYSTIRWITSSVPAFGAIGPSRVDPRTGEILDADILIEASIVQRRWKTYRDLIGPTGEALGVLPWLEHTADPNGRDQCQIGLGMASGVALANLTFALSGDTLPDSPTWEKFVGEMLVHTTLHEVGHTLGLRHNFRSSTATPYDKLEDATWTQEHGLVASVMDYATPNIAIDHGPQGEYYADAPGDCDLWMIRYGYTPSGAVGVDADYAFARKIADESMLPGHEYSTDEDTYGPDALDPRTNIFDLSNDPLRFARARTEWIANLWKSGKLDEKVLGRDGEYPVLRRAVDGTLEQYGNALGMAVKWVGGQYQSRNHRGQEGAKDPLVPVPAAKQREALEFLSQRAFAADAFTFTPALLNKLAPDRWSHWGVTDQFGIATGPRLDYNLNDKVLAIQNTILGGLLQPGLLARLREAESRSSEPFTLSEHFDRLTRMLWGEVGGASAGGLKTLGGTGTRRDLQRSYVDRLATMTVGPTPGLPDDARALARLQLVRIDSKASRALAGQTPMSDEVRAHLLETRARIKRALDASREADARGPGAVATPN